MNTRNADLTTVLDLLRDTEARKVDVVAHASTLSSRDTRLHVVGGDQEISWEGVTQTDGVYLPSTVAVEGIASKLDIPVKYARRMFNDRPDIWDDNINGWLRHDSRSFMVRCLKADDGEGIVRAFLSDTYKRIDNLDVLMSVLDGIRAAGVPVSIDGGDLTERRMRVRVRCEAISALAPTLLRGYRSPWSGQTGEDNPTVFAGFEISNSETGGGAFAITPRLVVQICDNGMTITKDALRNVHLGARMDEGVVRWSEATHQNNLELVRSQTSDAVRTFLDTDYVTRAITDLERKADITVALADVQDITRSVGFTSEEIDATLEFFATSGQMTLGGITNAATAAAQGLTDGDDAADLEVKAMKVLA